MRFGVDYAWGGPPGLGALERAGVKFVCRYFSFDPSKNLSKDEYDTLTRWGLEVKVAWETFADRARAGHGAGVTDATRAEIERQAVGMPDSQPIYFAIDFPAQGPEVEEYFRGVKDILGPRAGAYGGFRAIKHLFDTGIIEHGWQTYAWSGTPTQWDPRALLRQYANGHSLAGVNVDYDVMLEPSPGPYVPADERNWIREYDRLVKQHRAPWRRAFLRNLMTRRRKDIWHLMERDGGRQIRNRPARWLELVKRTE
jgi:hypothetical protein